MNLDTFALLSLMIVTIKDRQDGSSSATLSAHSSISCQPPVMTLQNSQFSIIYIEYSPIVILKGMILVFSEEHGLNYWEVLPLKFFFSLLNPTNEFYSYFNILEHLEINNKLI